MQTDFLNSGTDPNGSLLLELGAKSDEEKRVVLSQWYDYSVEVYEKNYGCSKTESSRRKLFVGQFFVWLKDRLNLGQEGIILPFVTGVVNDDSSAEMNLQYKIASNTGLGARL